jgi:hypothetical protein
VNVRGIEELQRFVFSRLPAEYVQLHCRTTLRILRA